MGAVPCPGRRGRSAGMDGLFRSDNYRSVALGDPAGRPSRRGQSGRPGRPDRTAPSRVLGLACHLPAPSVLAKLVVTVDHISGGRAELGIGAGCYEPSTRPTGSHT